MTCESQWHQALFTFPRETRLISQFISSCLQWLPFGPIYPSQESLYRSIENLAKKLCFLTCAYANSRFIRDATSKQNVTFCLIFVIFLESQLSASSYLFYSSTLSLFSGYNESTWSSKTSLFAFSKFSISALRSMFVDYCAALLAEGFLAAATPALAEPASVCFWLLLCWLTS